MKYDQHTDNRYLGLTYDTQSGIDVLKALLGLGRDKVSVRLMLSFALSKIEHRREKLEKMKTAAADKGQYQYILSGESAWRYPTNHIQLA